MDRFSDAFNAGEFPPLDHALINEVLDDSPRDASELLMLYFACFTGEPDDPDMVYTSDRIATTISDMADDGDEDAMMAMVAMSTLYRDDASASDIIVGVAMLRAVASRPLLRNVIFGDMDHEAATAGLSVINLLADHLLADVFDADELDDLDLDDIDFDRLANDLGVSDFDLDLDGDSDGR